MITIFNDINIIPVLSVGIFVTGCLYKMCSYSTAHSIIEGYTHFTYFIEPIATSIGNGWNTIKRNTEPMTTYLFGEIDWLMSREAREAREQYELENCIQYPWRHIVLHHGFKENRYSTIENIPLIESQQIILYQIQHTHSLYKRFDTVQEAQEWIKQSERPLKARIIEEYYELPQFIQIEPHQSRLDWREIVKPYQVKGNKVLDELFVQWITDNETRYIYPIQFIDCNISVGQIERNQWFRFGKGVEN